MLTSLLDVFERVDLLLASCEQKNATPSQLYTMLSVLLLLFVAIVVAKRTPVDDIKHRHVQLQAHSIDTRVEDSFDSNKQFARYAEHFSKHQRFLFVAHIKSPVDDFKQKIGKFKNIFFFLNRFQQHNVFFCHHHFFCFCLQTKIIRNNI
jgi:hypothetical protein